jgi:hypothetical protein
MTAKKKTGKTKQDSTKGSSPGKTGSSNPLADALALLHGRLRESGPEGAVAVADSVESILCRSLGEHDLLLSYDIRMLDSQGRTVVRNSGHSTMGHLADPATLPEAPQVLSEVFTNGVWRPLRNRFFSWLNNEINKTARPVDAVNSRDGFDAASEHELARSKGPLGLPSGSSLSE